MVMNACGHCDHQTWQEHQPGQRVAYYKCCHCGREREERTAVAYGGTVWCASTAGHGPHYPHVTATFGG